METCDRCKKEGQDRRTLMMACGAEMSQLEVPFREQTIFDEATDRSMKFFTMRVCKDCRGDWLAAIETWFQFTDPGKMLPATLAHNEVSMPYPQVVKSDPQLGSYLDAELVSQSPRGLCSCGYEAPGPLHAGLHLETNPGHRILK